MEKYGKSLGFMRRSFAVILGAGLLASCNNTPIADDIDPNMGLSRDDYKDMFYGQRAPAQKDSAPKLAMPDVSSLMIEPEKPLIAKEYDKLVTLSVTEEVPLKEVLMELARRADIDVEIDPQIEGGIIFRAKDRPFSEVIDRVAQLGGLRYSVDNGVLRLERDMPRVITYRLNMLDLTRKHQSEMNVNTSVTASNIGSGGGGEDGNTGGGSASKLQAEKEEGNLWNVVTDGVTNILLRYGNKNAVAQAAASNNARRNSSRSSYGSTGGTFGAGGSGILSVNRSAGLITVLANDRQHKEVKSYLDYVSISQTTQVLIEAKVLEVSLKDEYRTGIDWEFKSDDVYNNTTLPSGDYGDGFLGDGVRSLGAFSNLGTNSDQMMTLGVLTRDLFGDNDASLQTTLKLVEAFGTTRTLSSPRLHAMNNEYAVLSFAKNHVFFEMEAEEEERDDNNGGNPTTVITIDSEIKTVPIGVMLALQPSIDLQRNEIIMNIRPTLSRITSEVEDPGVKLIANRLNADSIQSLVPVVEAREIDTVLRIKSGEVMVIGGLMEERAVNNDRGVPGASRVPFLGNAFKSVQKESEVIETVIFIKATIVPGQGVSVEDQEFYNKFSKERNRLTF